jgi:hypothetical protein
MFRAGFRPALRTCLGGSIDLSTLGESSTPSGMNRTVGHFFQIHAAMQIVSGSCVIVQMPPRFASIGPELLFGLELIRLAV